MEVSTRLFHLCKIFIDETQFVYKGEKCFMLGGIFLPIDCDINVELGKVRRKNFFLHTLHFARGKNFSEKELAVAKGFLQSFVESTACFRAIVVKESNWKEINNWKSRARLAGLLLSFPWVLCEGKIYKILSRPRVIFDRSSLNNVQERDFNLALNRMLRTKNKVSNIEDSSMVFADKRIFDELQLVDIILGLIRISYLREDLGEISSQKINLHDYFLTNFPLMRSFVGANRGRTRQKIDVWDFVPRS